jgi:hypothetical protein
MNTDSKKDRKPDMQKAKTQIESILPPIRMVTMRDEADYYGASRIIAKSLGLPFKPKSFTGWKHGWLHAPLKYVEQLTGNSRYTRFLVATKEHELFLRQHNVEAKAVGMPFLYVDTIETKSIERMPNSLLVMPPHSLPYTNHAWSEELYTDQIAALADDFDTIVACLHHSCVQKKLWIDAFEKHGIPWIIGADSTDKNALLRMHRIFLSFEYMTTNAIGSHIVYAAYCGCKVSVYGTYQEYTEEDYKHDTAYQKFPFLLKHNLASSTEKSIREAYPFLFSYPAEATPRREWAGEQMGDSNRVAAEEIAKWLGWRFAPQLNYLFFELPKKIIAKIGRHLRTVR